ncbi:VasL domain-containing protein [Cedecea sp. FDAARGOS_727]|uniref:VasL domain-containing protein n=1 Tax=Cedecea sp. FDAARGOS_727 TaxID=2545798 RepID=UPI0020B1198A|nr:VasL domain-containing protein [Cedecea sp. FDAARGOS_727]
MSQAYERQLKTGGDPRTMPDYAALRDELGKLSHPARPDVNWAYVERLALNLFDSNGVDLQTAAWFTLARTQLAGVYGFNEGLAIVDALVRYQWSAMWPASVHARIEIISGLSKRLQQVFRTLSLQRVDLAALYRSERLLAAIGEVLQRLELRNAAGIEALRQMLQNDITRLENSDAAAPEEHQPQAVVLPIHTVNSEASEGAPRWVYVVHDRPEVEVEIKTEAPRRITPLKAFVCGLAVSAALAGLVGVAIPALLNHPAENALMASVAELPATLPAAEVETLHRESPGWLHQNVAYGSQLQSRLEELGRLPPYWPLLHGERLVEQTWQLYPGSEMAKNAAGKWRAMMVANALPASGAAGWRHGVAELQMLQQRLNQLDEKKGKYLTVSELKTVVFSVSKSLNDEVPAEELVRRLQDLPADEPVPQALQGQLESRLRQLLNSYMLIKMRHEDEQSGG